MPQISLYIDQELLELVENAAKHEHLSISRWVGTQLRKTLRPTYTEHFEDLFGSVKDRSFKRPEEALANLDALRETL